MLLTISTEHRPATDLGFLLHKHPDRFQSFDLAFGRAHVFYSEANEGRCSACLLLDIDPVGLVRGKQRRQDEVLGRYVNDRPYVASSFMSVALARVYRSAMAGHCKDREALADTPIPLRVKIDVLPVRGGGGFLLSLFEPLGYRVEAERQPLDEQFPAWGDSPYYSVTLHVTRRLSEVLSHLYVLIPVFDNLKHYYVGEDELEKLLEKGAGWLADHPQKAIITRRYLKSRSSLLRQALARLVQDEGLDEGEEPVAAAEEREAQLEKPLSLDQQRRGAVMAALRGRGARHVLDLGCGEGRLLKELLDDARFERVVGMDVSIRALEIAEKRLKLDRLPPKKAERLQLWHGSLIYRDSRLQGFDAAAVVEVIEHLEASRLSALERVLFEFARPRSVVLTTPNREYNQLWASLPAGRLRHQDHRFEWTRAEFRDWAEGVAERFGYRVGFLSVGPEHETLGSPTQMGLFELPEGG